MDIFTGIFGIVIGSVCIWVSLRILKLYFKVNSWERVDAKVISKEVTIHEKYSTSRTPYKLNATYVYNYQNQEFTGNHIYLVELMKGQANHMKSDADRRLAKINDTMKIYVNPKNPKESLMYCEGIILYVFLVFMGLFGIIYGISKVM